jgi:hypothetical protein
MAKFLLGNERISIADTGPKIRLLRDLHAKVQADERTPAPLKES